MIVQMDKKLAREKIAKRAEKEIQSGYYVNLGIGMPTLVANFLDSKKEVVFHSENGLIGIGRYPVSGELDPDLINAGKETVTAIKGASYVDSADSFAMIRGGHLDVTILGGMEVSENGDLANWTIPGKLVKGMGGAMDLVHGVNKIIVVMTHTNKNEQPKIVRKCNLPLTGRAVVDRIITERAVIDVTKNGLVLMEVAQGWSVEGIMKSTEAKLEISENIIMEAY